jgi:Tfp pilus assembly protein PilF
VQIEPRHAGALHVLGVWNAEIMRLNSLSRFAARRFLGAKSFDRASWAEARRYMEAAVAADPGRITHRLDLALIYADDGDTQKARSTCEAAMRMPTLEFNDARYKQRCEKLIARLR